MAALVAADITRRRYWGGGPDQGNRVLRRGEKGNGQDAEMNGKRRRMDVVEGRKREGIFCRSREAGKIGTYYFLQATRYYLMYS